MATPGKPQIWFFDDGVHNAPSEENHMIHFELVNSSGPPKPYGKVSRHFYEKAPGSKYVTVNVDSEYMDPLSGIQESEIFKLKDAASKGEVLAVVFDWDRTLTMIEGISAPPNRITHSIGQYKNDLVQKYSSMEGMEKMSDKDVAHYYFHNPSDGDTKEDVEKRPHLIGTMLRDLQSMRIPIFILTNNQAGKVVEGVQDQRGLLADMLKQIGVDIPKDHIIFNYARNKEKMIMDVILPMVETERRKGGRRTRRKRVRFQIKRTRKRGTRKRGTRKRGTRKRDTKKRGTRKGKKTKGRH